jgi:hypothetical protein
VTSTFTLIDAARHGVILGKVQKITPKWVALTDMFEEP